MVYLIIDTNTWLYLANCFDTISCKIDSHSGKHINVFDQIKQKSNTAEFTVLVTDIILFEWEKNKQTAKLHINQLEAQKKIEIAEVVKIKSTLSLSDFKLKCAEINNQFNEKILNAQNHIENVDDFLKTCPKYNVSDEIKLEIADMAISKEKAPFLNSKNNVADAAILFGAITFLKSNQKEHIEKAVFNSANYKEYGISKVSKEFHPDIKERLDGIHLDYHQNWIDLIGLTEDLQYEIDMFHEYMQDNFQFSCLSEGCQYSIEEGYILSSGYLHDKIRLARTNEKIDPNQQYLFPLEEIKNLETSHFVLKGDCNFCGSNHVECPTCYGLIIELNSDGQYYCSECDQGYQLEVSLKYKDQIIFPIEKEKFHL